MSYAVGHSLPFAQGVFHVKHYPEDEAVTAYLRQYSRRHALDVPAERLDRIASLVSWLAPASHRLGLTKYADPMAMSEQLVAPALLLLAPSLSPHVSSPMLDFGAGSGAVGLSLATAMPASEIVLADRRRRVVQFLDLAVHRHDLGNCRSLVVDLADMTAGLESDFGTILVRAFGPVDQALISAQAWLKPGGVVALWHRPGACFTPDGLTALRTEETELPSLVLTLYQRV